MESRRSKARCVQNGNRNTPDQGLAGRGAKAPTQGLALRGGKAPKQAAGRAKDWSAAMGERFIETLAETCNVTLAAQAIGRSMSNVYKRRTKDATFRASWNEALAIGYSRLEMMLLERALHGVEKVVVAKDGSQSVMREYPDRVALTLLRMHRDSVARSDQVIDEQAVHEARDRIMARIERLRARSGKRVETKGMMQLNVLLRVVNRRRDGVAGQGGAGQGKAGQGKAGRSI